MNKVYAAVAASVLLQSPALFAQKAESIPFGNMDKWQTRVIKESFLLGGDTKTMHAINNPKTVEGAVPYKRNTVSPWATSNVYASPAGIVKTSVTVFPEKRGNGYCARLEVREERCKAVGLVNIVVVASGSVFLGGMDEPIKSAKNPMSKLDQGIPFNKKPIAVQFDYKNKRCARMYKATGGTRINELSGSDQAEVVLYLLHRWEDEQGNVYAHRIGTAYEKYGKTVSNWINNHQVKVHYGDITKEPFYKSYMGLIPESNPYYTTNSKGVMVPVHEVGWGDKDDTVTHIMLRFSSSDQGPYVGTVGSTFWIDNVKLIY